MAHPGGRPPKWTDPKVLKALVDEYFVKEDKATLAGLAYYLGVDRSTLYEYGNKDGFSHIIKEARDRVVALYESLLVYRNQNPTGVIFALKNMGWKDRSDITTNDKELPAAIYGGKSTK